MLECNTTLNYTQLKILLYKMKSASRKLVLHVLVRPRTGTDTMARHWMCISLGNGWNENLACGKWVKGFIFLPCQPESTWSNQWKIWKSKQNPSRPSHLLLTRCYVIHLKFSIIQELKGFKVSSYVQQNQINPNSFGEVFLDTLWIEWSEPRFHWIKTLNSS